MFGLGFVAKKIFSAIVTRKRIIGWVAAIVLAGAAVASGISVEELKAGIAAAPVIELGQGAQSESAESK